MDDMYQYLADAGINQENIYVFERRLNDGEIPSSEAHKALFDDEDISNVLSALRLEADKFLNLVLFAHDYAKDLCSHGVVEEEGGYDMMWTLIDRGRRLVSNESPPPIKVDASCTFRLQGRNYKVKDADSIAVLLYWIHRGMIHMDNEHPIWELNWLINDYDNRTVERQQSVSVMIWCFASVIQRFFKANPHYRGHIKRESGISTNKLLLISRLVYAMGMSSNDNFLYSDETLKGFMKQYKKHVLPDKGMFYVKVITKGE